MKKIIISILGVFVILFANAHQDKKLRISAKSKEIKSVKGSLIIEFDILTNDDDIIIESSELRLPEGWLGNSENSNTKVKASIDYPSLELPFYVQRVTCFVKYKEHEKIKSANEVAYVYFTPYGTVEVWSQYDFENLNRYWFSSSKKRQRVKLKKEDIPISNLPEVDDIEGWSKIKEEDIQSVYVDGLAYSIPMLVDEKAKNKQDNSNNTEDNFYQNQLRKEAEKEKGGPSSPSMMPPADGCGVSYNRYLGHITGRITGGFINSETNNWFGQGLEGLVVEVWDDEATIDTKLGTGYTLQDGSFDIYVNDCQWLEGGEVELYIKIKAKNNAYDIKGYNSSLGVFIDVAQSGVEDWVYNNGNNLDYDFGDIEVFDQPHKAVHLASKAYRFMDDEAGTYNLPNKLHIRTNINWLTNAGAVAMFVPNSYCGVNQYLAGLGLALLNPYLGVAVAASDPTIFMADGEANVDETLYHEFGHFAMWHLQNKCWIGFGSGGLEDYDFDVENGPAISWTEGWAEGFAAICDAYFHNDDNESRVFSGENYEIKLVENVNSGIECIEYIAATLLDLYDGPVNYNHIANPIEYNENVNNNGFDNIEIPFFVITQVLAGGHVGGSNGNITHIQDFYEELQDYFNDCNTHAQIKQIFDDNRILFDVTDPNSGFAVDDIYYNQQSPNYGGGINTGVLGAGVIQTWNYNYIEHRDIGIINADNGNYNLGYHVNGYTPFIGKDLTIANGYHLQLNDDAATMFYNAAPVLNNSHLNVETCGDIDLDVYGEFIIGDELGNETAEFHGNAGFTLNSYAGSDVIISENSTLILENNSIFNAYGGNLLIESGAELIVRAGAIIDFNNTNSNITVENGGRIIIENGGNLNIGIYDAPNFNLAGNNSVIDIDGVITLENGAVFAPVGNGFTNFSNPVINMGTNSEMNFTGNYPTDVVVIVENNTNIFLNDQPTAEFVVNNGTVWLGTNSIFDFNSVEVNLTDAEFRGTSTNYYNEVRINGQTKHTLTRTLFRYGQVGLHAFQEINDRATLVMNDCEILDCSDVGLWVNGAGVDLTDVFIHNIINDGYRQDFAVQPSTLDNCEFTNCNNGIWYNGSANAPIHLNDPLVWANHNNGVEISGYTTLTGQCGSISQNPNAGIYVGVNSRLELVGNTDMNITDNGVSIFLNKAYMFDLDDGYNDFVPTNELTETVIQGSLRKTKACYNYLGLFPLQDDNNHWNTQGAQLSGKNIRDPEDYELVDDDGIKVVMTGMGAVANSCGPQPPNTGGCNPYCEISVINNCPGCEKINTPSYSNVKMNDAMRDAVETMEKHNSLGTGDNLLAIDKFNEVLTYSYTSISTDEREILDFGYDKMKEVFGDAVKGGQISRDEVDNRPILNLHAQQVLDVVLMWKQDGSTGQGPFNGPIKLAGGPCDPIVVHEIIIGDEGHVYKAVGRNSDAIGKFDDIIQTSPDQDVIDIAEYWKCLTQKDDMVNKGIISEQQYKTDITLCRSLLPIPASPNFNLGPNKGNNSANRESNGSGSIAYIELHPNPAQNNVNIIFELSEESSYEIEMFDATGKKVIIKLSNQEGKKGVNTQQIDLSDIETGFYFVKISAGEHHFIEKLVVSK